jgi:amino acid permease
MKFETHDDILDDIGGGPISSPSSPSRSPNGAPAADGEQACSTPRAYVNTFLSFVGAGILGLPFAFSRTGMFAAGFVLVMVAVLSCRCTLQLIHCKQSPLLRGATIESYGDLGFHAYGRFGAIAVDVALVISQCAFCCAYLIFIGTNLHSVFPSVSDYAAVLLLCPFLAGLATIRYLKQLAPFSLIADVANIGGILLVLYQYSWEPGYWEAAVGGGGTGGAGATGGAAAGGAGAGDAVTAAAAAAAAVAAAAEANALALVNNTTALAGVNGPNGTNSNSTVALGPGGVPRGAGLDINYSVDWAMLPFFFGVAVYCFEGVGTVVPIERSMADRGAFPRVLAGNMTVVTSLYFLFGAAGYYAFGGNTLEIITLNLEQGTLPDIVKTALCIGLFFT